MAITDILKVDHLYLKQFYKILACVDVSNISLMPMFTIDIQLHFLFIKCYVYEDVLKNY